MGGVEFGRDWAFSGLRKRSKRARALWFGEARPGCANLILSPYPPPWWPLDGRASWRRMCFPGWLQWLHRIAGFHGAPPIVPPRSARLIISQSSKATCTTHNLPFLSKDIFQGWRNMNALISGRTLGSHRRRCP